MSNQQNICLNPVYEVRQMLSCISQMTPREWVENDEELKDFVIHSLSCKNYKCQRATIIAIIEKIKNISSIVTNRNEQIIYYLNCILDKTAGGTIKKFQKCAFTNRIDLYLNTQNNVKITNDEDVNAFWKIDCLFTNSTDSSSNSEDDIYN